MVPLGFDSATCGIIPARCARRLQNHEVKLRLSSASAEDVTEMRSIDGGHAPYRRRDSLEHPLAFTQHERTPPFGTLRRGFISAYLRMGGIPPFLVTLPASVVRASSPTCSACGMPSMQTISPLSTTRCDTCCSRASSRSVSASVFRSVDSTIVHAVASAAPARISVAVEARRSICSMQPSHSLRRTLR